LAFLQFQVTHLTLLVQACATVGRCLSVMQQKNLGAASTSCRHTV